MLKTILKDDTKDNIEILLKMMNKEIKEISQKLDVIIEKSEHKKEKQILTSNPCKVNAIFE